MINQNRIIENFLALTLVDGIHGKEYDVAMRLIPKLQALGFEVKVDDAGKTFGGNSGNIIARLPGNADVHPIFLCAHMDTIQPTKNLVHIIKDGIIYSDGNTILGGDNRAGIAVVLEIVETIIENKIPHGNLEIIFTVCEEAGMYGAKALDINDLESRIGFVFDCQASPGSYIIEAPGAVSFTAHIKGKSAHAAVSPQNGVHAIHIASKAIANLKLGRWAETGMMNIGTIEGGKAINVIPDLVKITGETRNANEDELNSQIEYLKSAFENPSKELGGSVDLVFNAKYGGYQFQGDEPFLIPIRKGIIDSGFEPIPIKYPGGSDANVLNKKGLTAVNLGVGFKNAHSFNECISIKNLVGAANIGLNIVKNCN
jgi:tripeptide aminopeptidase